MTSRQVPDPGRNAGWLRRLVHRVSTRPDASIAEALARTRWWPVLSVGLGPLLGMAAFSLAGRVPSEILSADAKVMLGIFTLAAWYWITAAIPPFATGVLVIGLGALLLGYPAAEGRPFGAAAGESQIVSWTDFVSPAAAPVVVLMLGGFVLGRATHATGLDNLLARLLLKPFARSPGLLVLGVLLVTAVLSMWMSNTATAVMMCTLVGPLCHTLGEGSGLRRALLLAVPVGANVGGLGTPIGTPPNAIVFAAFKAAGLEVSFLAWVAVATPVALGLLVIAWVALLRLYPADDRDRELARDLSMPPPERGGWPTVVTGATFAATVVLWLTSPWTDLPIAAAAIVPLMVFAATGILTRHDVNGLEWDILLLIAGGLALGKGMEATGLAAWMVGQVPLEGLPSAALIAVVTVLTLLMSTLMSNTATANLVLPIALGIAGGAISPVQAGLGVAFGASLAMGLPVSTPPNAIAYAAGGLRVVDFLRMGALLGVIGVGVTLLVALFAAGLLR